MNKIGIAYTFMSKGLRGDLKYTIMEKKAYALVQALKHFKGYVGYSRIVSLCSTPTMKDILSQQECLGIRGKWISRIQEYDLEIKPTKLVKGQGLARMLIEGNEKALNIGGKIDQR
jgi:hypothetical protein